MKKILMLGSSHSAAYKSVEAESLGLEIHIAANSDGNLFKNLCIDSDGTLSLSKQAEAWDKKVWQYSLNASTAKINAYDFLIMNIRWNYDLPQAVHGDNCDLINYYLNILTPSMQKYLISDQYFSVNGSRQTLQLVEKLVRQTGFSKEKILICPEPFSTFPRQCISKPQTLSAKNKIRQILEKYIPALIAERTELRFLLPAFEMLENGFFVHHRYYPYGESGSNWNNLINNTCIVDRKHKNSSYASDLLSANIGLFL